MEITLTKEEVVQAIRNYINIESLEKLLANTI